MVQSTIDGTLVPSSRASFHEALPPAWARATAAGRAGGHARGAARGRRGAVARAAAPASAASSVPWPSRWGRAGPAACGNRRTWSRADPARCDHRLAARAARRRSLPDLPVHPRGASGDRRVRTAALRRRGPGAGRAPAAARRARRGQAILRARYFTVSKQGRPAAITGYHGTGPLGAWVRVSAVREVYRIAESRRRWRPLEGARLARIAAPSDDPELRYLKAHYRDSCRRLRHRDARAETPPAQPAATLLPRRADDRRHRRALSRAPLDGLSLGRAGLRRGRPALRGASSPQAGGQPAPEVASIMRLIESQFDVSIRGYLADQGDEP